MIKKVFLIMIAAVCFLGYFPELADAGTTSQTVPLPEYCNEVIGNAETTTLYTKTTDDKWSDVFLIQSNKDAIYTRVYYFDWEEKAILPANPETITYKGKNAYLGYYYSVHEKTVKGAFVRLSAWNYKTGTNMIIYRWDYH